LDNSVSFSDDNLIFFSLTALLYLNLILLQDFWQITTERLFWRQSQCNGTFRRNTLVTLLLLFSLKGKCSTSYDWQE